MFKVTETLLTREVKRPTLERAKLIAYDMVIRMFGTDDDSQLGTEVRRIHRWTGKGNLRIRHGREFVNMEGPSK